MGALGVEQTTRVVADEHAHGQLGVVEMDEVALRTDGPRAAVRLTRHERRGAAGAVARGQVGHWEARWGPDQKGRMTREKRS